MSASPNFCMTNMDYEAVEHMKYKDIPIIQQCVIRATDSLIRFSNLETCQAEERVAHEVFNTRAQEAGQ